jgi:hypothetical protein
VPVFFVSLLLKHETKIVIPDGLFFASLFETLRKPSCSAAPIALAATLPTGQAGSNVQGQPS